MLVSANRTVVELVAVEAVACAEALDLALDLLLLGLEPGELGLPSSAGFGPPAVSMPRTRRGCSCPPQQPRPTLRSW